MEYETLETIMNSPALIATAVGVASAAVAYTVGRLTSGSKYKIEKEKTKQAQIQLEITKVENQGELEKLRYDNADSDQKRQTDLIELRRKHELEDQKGIREQYLEDKERKKTKTLARITLKDQRKESKRQHRLQLADRLVQLQPVLVEYLDSLKPSEIQEDPDYLTQRRDYRAELVKKTLKEINENGDGIMDDIVQKESDPINTAIEAIINKLIDQRYPLDDKVRTPKMPKELRRLIKAVL
ncbi:hypothetical protein GOV12_04400 [Candidatus Pacearchaeota archaeon]|nr:hypothetical protein [Candidatus Pacearchaeota archaeon]